MLCPNCGHDLPNGAVYCFRCGERLPSSIPAPIPPQPGADSASDSPGKPKKPGTHLVPIVIMVVLCALGLGLFFALPYDTESLSTGENLTPETPWFVNDDGTLYFLDYLYSGPEELTIPDLVDGIPVEHIGDYCFSGCDWITTVILPDTLVSIGEEAFFGCTDMRGIFIPEGVTEIGENAFLSCVSLEAICIPSSVEQIGDGAFDGCSNLAYILYNGIHSHWKRLYSDYITIETQVYCTDGTFVHRKGHP